MSGQNIEIVKLQIRRGTESQLPILDQGEPAITTDTHKLFIGDGTTNHQFAHQEDLDATNVQLAEITNQRAYVESFAKQTGESDDTARVQRAINSLTSGGEVIFAAKTYNVSSPITVNVNYLKLSGLGTGITTITTSSATGDIFTVGDGSSNRKGILFEKMTISSSVTRTSDYGINFNNVFYSQVQNVDFKSQFASLRLNATVIYIDKININDTTATNGLGILIDGGNDHFLSRIIMDTSLGTQPSAGLQITSTGGTWVNECDFIHAGTGLLINPTSTTVQWLFMKDTAFDTCSGNGILINVLGSTGVVKGLTFTNCWTSSCATGVYLIGVANSVVDGIRFLGHRSLRNNGHGFNLPSSVVKNVSIQNGDIAGNSVSATGTFHGINVATGVSNFMIQNNRIGAAIGYGITQGYGILINSGSSNNYVVTGNQTSDNVTQGISDGGTGLQKVVASNL